MQATARAAILLLAAATSACHVIEPEGRRQRVSFTTSLTPQQARAETESWLVERAQYDLTSSEARFVRAEKRRPRSTGPGEQIDVLSVDFTSIPEGTEVEITALTFEVAVSGARNRADQVSPEAIRDADMLARVLMPRP
jgi:hypothetical protein